MHLSNKEIDYFSPFYSVSSLENCRNSLKMFSSAYSKRPIVQKYMNNHILTILKLDFFLLHNLINQAFSFCPFLTLICYLNSFFSNIENRRYAKWEKKRLIVFVLFYFYLRCGSRRGNWFHCCAVMSCCHGKWDLKLNVFSNERMNWTWTW